LIADMKSAKCVMAVSFLAMAAIAPANDSTPTHSLSISPSTPRVDISVRNPGRTYIRLPTLEFTFDIAANCSALFSPQSVSLNIADSRETISIDESAGRVADVQLGLNVPAKQLAPLVVENFCVAPVSDDNQDDARQHDFSNGGNMIVRSVLSVQAALLCVNEDEQEMVYQSRPLDITLVCNAEDDAAE
jgi:hypothetical protein